MEANQDTTLNAIQPQTTDGAESVITASNVEEFNHKVDEYVVKVDELEQKVNEVEQFYSSLSKQQSNTTPKGNNPSLKEKDKKHVYSLQRMKLEAAKRESESQKRMQELIKQFGTTIFRQITTHKWAWPFMHPVDVEGLGLHDYFEVIDKPMDFSTIKNQMEAKDGTGYKNVREICADVRLVFKNAMLYNDDRNDVHVMAKTLMDKFEEKWLQFLPKVLEEETRREEEEAQSRLDMQLAQEAANAKMARQISKELGDLEKWLADLTETVVQNCRKISGEEKRKIGSSLSKLSPQDLSTALEIIAQGNPNFQAADDEIEIDMDAQSESTLWKLKFFVKGALEGKSNDSPEKISIENNKRKREICNALAKSAKKRSKRLAS